jgi:DNA invertase Pin-like site-specific DNA recombinase
MIAAIYAPRSTEQAGIVDEQKLVARQVEHAAYAARRGWAVADAHVYVDDGISGAEFANRPGFLRLMNALKPRPRFQVLVVSEESRLGREQIEVSYALKQIVSAGVQVFFYLENRERTLDSPTDKIMLSLTRFADELEREKARQRTYDAMIRKAKSSHQRVNGILEVGKMHDLVIPNRQQIAFDTASRIPRAAPAVPEVEGNDAVRVLVPSAISPVTKARVLQHERAVIIEDEPRLLR